MRMPEQWRKQEGVRISSGLVLVSLQIDSSEKVEFTAEYDADSEEILTTEDTGDTEEILTTEDTGDTEEHREKPNQTLRILRLLRFRLDLTCPSRPRRGIRCGLFPRNAVARSSCRESLPRNRPAERSRCGRERRRPLHPGRRDRGNAGRQGG